MGPSTGERRDLPKNPIIKDETVKSALHVEDAIPAVEAVLAELSNGLAKNFVWVGMETEMGIFRFMAGYSPLSTLRGSIRVSGALGSRGRGLH